MPSLREIYNDKSAYPDTMEIDLGNGVKTSLKEWRNEMGPKAEFTQHTQQLAAEKRQTEAQLAQAQAQLANALAMTGQNPNLARGPMNKLAEYENDPLFAPIMGVINELKGELTQAKQVLGQHENQYWIGQHMKSISEIQARDAEFKDPQKINELTTRAMQLQNPNLDHVHQIMTRDRDIQRASEKAAKEAYERGKQEAALPRIPTGMRSVPKPDANVPGQFGRESEVAAMNDPEIMKAAMGEV